MGEGLLAVLVWMPTLEGFCGGSDLEYGSLIACLFYALLSFWTFFKPLLTISYHHESEIVILQYIQCVFNYTACFCAFFVFFLAFAMARSMKEEKLAFNPRSIFTHSFMILCLIMGCSDIIWGILAFVRAFIDPGLWPADLRSNKSVNPYPNSDVCTTYTAREYGNARSHRKTKCRKRTVEEIEKKQKWDLDHANDTIVYEKSELFDAIYSFCSILFHLYGFYLVVVFRSYTLELLEEEEDEGEK